jgi:hypothetical protein
MSTKHTPGRLIARNFSIYELDGMQPIADACIGLNGDRSSEHARRLAACWNALEDLSQDALDGGWTRAGLEAYGLEMTAQRDELLEALHHAEAWIGSAPHGDNCFVSAHYEGDPGDRCNCGKDSALEAVQDAIAKATGSAS